MGNLAIWGAPGTGKTYALTGKYIQDSGKKLLVSFRKETAANVRNALTDLTGEEVTKDNVNTIHGTCYRLLGGTGYAKKMEDRDYRQFQEDTGYKVSPPVYDPRNPGKSTGLVDCLGWLKNTGTSGSNITRFPGWQHIKLSPARARETLEVYEEWKQEQGKLDFADMLTDVLKRKLIPDCDMLLVDEFQDLTYLQYEIFKMWADKIDNVVIAGDPLQSMYDYWGGSPEFFKQFQAEHVTLGHSYRLPQVIWDYAVNVATRGRMEVPQITAGEHAGTITHQAYTQYLKSTGMWGGIPDNTVFHLIRSNYQAPAIAHEMARNGILWTGINGWSEHELTVLNVLIRARQSNSRPILSKHDMLALLEQFPLVMFEYGGTKQSIKTAIKKEHRGDYGPLFGGESLYKALESTNPESYMSMAGDLKKDKFQNALAKYNRPITLDEVKATTLTTIHGSKGLEADRVFLHTGITSNIKKKMRKDWAGEARVFYVGITRAKQDLITVKDKGQNFPLPGVR